jgi:endonuclease/exonuclease/phosphatase (EEP) superfamily protein YafD
MSINARGLLASSGEQSFPKLLWAGFWIGNLVLVGLFGAGTIAYYVPPRYHWELQLIAILVPYLGCGVVGVAVGAALGRHWHIAAFHTVLFGGLLIVTAFVERAPRTTADSTDPIDAPALTVVSFNANREYAGSKDDELSRLLTRERPHLVALQEIAIRLTQATGVISGSSLIGPLLRGRAYAPSWPPGNNDVLYPLPVFSRIEASEPATILSGDSDEVLWKSGSIGRTRYQWQGQTITVYNVHLHSFSRERPWKKREGKRRLFSPMAWYDALRSYRSDFLIRAEQARQLHRILEAEPYPFIVCGDLNSTPRNWVYGHIAQDLQDAFRRAGRGWGGTYHARLPLVRIDVVFASEEWEIRDAHVSRTVASDHFPVLAELALPPRSQPSTNDGEGK